jgi:hypothetical protein
MNKNIITELSRMKDLFIYEKGKVISEQRFEAEPRDNFKPFSKPEKKTTNPVVNQPKQKNTPETNVDVFANFPCLATFSTEKKATSKGTKSLKIGSGNFSQYMFESDGTLYSNGQEYGTWKCGTKPNTININGKELSVGGTQKTPPAGQKTKQSKQPSSNQGDTYLAPPELKQKVGDKTGVQAFQDWLDKTYSGWHTKYKTLNGETLKGYGKFGPLTSAAWTKYKTEYIKQNPNLAQDVQKIQSKTDSGQEDDDFVADAEPGATPQTAQAGTSLTSGKQLANATAPTLKQTKTPEEYYKELYDKKLIEGDPEGQGRLRYRGPELNQEQQNMLTAAMDKMGYEFLRKGNDKRLVYRKK